MTQLNLSRKKFPDTDVIISDDGLQHYKLARDYECCVIDASRMLGNQLCIPAGPLREPAERLGSVDCVVVIGKLKNDDKEFLELYNDNIVQAKIILTRFVNLASQEVVEIDAFYAKSVTAIAGIGNPDKFFSSLSRAGVNIQHEKIFKDHHKFKVEDFQEISSSEIVVMTYKDAIKCKDFAKENWWYLDIDLSGFDLSLSTNNLL